MKKQSGTSRLSRLAISFIAGVFAVSFVGQAVLPMTAKAAPATILNPNLTQTTNNVPNCYTQAGWGTHNATWAMTTDAHSGTSAQSVTITGYQSGDRKLIMSESENCAPAVTPGQKYDLGVWYKSTSAKNSLTVFRHSAAGWTYWTELAAPAASANWAQVKATTPVVPAGTDQITFGLSLAGNGTLKTDDYSFAPTQAAPPVVPPANGELTTNGGLENGANMPTGWNLSGWGDGQMTAGVTTAGVHGGTRAYQITLKNRTNGDYKLLPTEANSPAVTPGKVYKLSTWYKATTANNSVTVFTHTANGWNYWTDIQALPASANWAQVNTETAPIPAGVDQIAWGISTYGNGTLTTDDYSTMEKGTATGNPTGAAVEGKWTILDYQLPVRAIHSTLLKNGKILLIAGSGNDLDSFKAGSFKASIWDPTNGQFTTLNVPKDMFCSGHATLPDGRILIQGGTKNYPTSATAVDYGGIKDSYIFDPDTNLFTKTNDANEGHWYPTLTALGNGNIWMGGGLKEDTSGAVNTEMFDSKTNAWLPTNQITQTYSFWGLYPHMFLMQDGRLFYSGAHTFGNGLPGTGASIYDPTKGTIADVQGLRQKDMRDQAASVLLPPAQDQKVLITGGGNINTNTPAINLTDVIDLKQANPTYTPAPDLPGLGKMYVNATTLPDRTILTSNGGQLNRDNNTNVLTAALYDSATNKFTSIPADPIARNYHSSTILLPDGRVAVIGSNPGDGSFELRISVYDPSYQFRGGKPTITGTPATMNYGQQYTFNATAANGKTIKWAQLMRPMSVTHHMDSNMRLVDLPVNVANGKATVNVTANNNLLPPGPYMLTLTDSDNVPSAAQWVMVK